MFAWMQRRQAESDLRAIRSMTDEDRGRTAILCAASWEVLRDACNFLAINPVDALSLRADSPLLVSKIRISVAAQNAPNEQLFALSVWQTTARASQNDADPRLVATAAALWAALGGAAERGINALSGVAEELAADCHAALTAQQRQI